MAKIVEYRCCNLYDARGCKCIVIIGRTSVIRYNLYDARGCKYHKYRKALRENDIATYMMHVGG